MNLKKRLQLMLEKICFPLYSTIHIKMQQRILGKKYLLLDTYFQRSNKSVWLKGKKSDTLFILGCGASICDYGEHEWNQIRKGDSVGVNFWAIHDFVPDFYSIEVSCTEDSPRMQSLFELFKLKKREYSNVKFYIKDVWRTTDAILNMPKDLWSCMYLGEDYEIPGETKESFSKSISKLASNKYNFEKDRLLLYKKRATISLWVYFAYAMGYKNVVLCGVDLNNTAYFYEENFSYYQNKGIPVPCSGQDGTIHKTMDRKHGEVTIDWVLTEMDKYLLQPSGVHLFVGSKKSALYPKIPYYWD